MSDCSDNMTHGCDDALASLYLYLDSELDDASAEKIRSHLEDCPVCDQSFDFERRLKTVVRQRLDEDVPDTLMRRVREALEAEQTGSAR